MTTFKIPDPKKIFTLDLENLGGCDEYSQTPLATRSPDMRNIINRLGMHQVRENIEQTYIVNHVSLSTTADDDKHCDIKWIGKIEEYDDLGNPIPYYIKISEYLGTKDVADDSYIYVSVWPSPDVRNISFDMSTMPGYEHYRITYKKYTFTNYGDTGNTRGLYEDVEFDGKIYVFTPIGILSFKCKTDEQNNIKTLNFDVDNVLNDPYVPTIIISAAPDGTAKTTLEAVNILTNKRHAQFLGTQADTTYQLPEHPIMAVNYIKVLQNDGQYTTLDPSNYTVNTLTGVITFGLAPGESPVSGKDNVIVEYSKNPLEGNETNTFKISTETSLLKSMVDITKATNQTDPTKIDVSMNIKIVKGTNFDSTRDLKNCTLTIKAGTQTPYTNMFTSQSDLNQIMDNGLTFTQTSTIDSDGATDSRNWIVTLNGDIETTTTTSTTTGVPGSVGGNTSMGRKYYDFATYLGLSIDARAVPHLGTKADGSDSYWDVYASPRIYTTGGGYLDAGSRDVSGIIDGVNAGSLNTGNLQGSGTWPSSGEVHRRINYSSNKHSVTISVSCYVDITFGGVYYGTVTSGNYTLNLPSIQPPTQQTITDTTVSTSTDTASTSYSEGIKNPEESTINYENNAETSARLACYYSTKATTVYGYENDRRVFVTNGSNTDTFSGRPRDPNYSSISYFPDINYNVLGEGSNILGYAQKAGYLFTVKEGADSLYVRKGSVIGDDIQFPSIMVRRNIQILCRPIEIDGNIYVITRNGLEEIGFDYVYSYTYELLTYLRSYYVSNYFKLGVDYKYKQMEWFNESGLLHIYLDNYEFIFDLNSKSYVKDVSSSLGSQITKGLPYQFEAYVCTVPRLNANLYAPKFTVYLPKDFERAEYGVVNEDIIPYGYNSTGIYKLSYSNNKVDILKEIVSGNEITNYYPIQAHYFTPFLDFNTTTQLKTIKQLAINTTGHNGDEYYIGYVLPDGTQLLIDKILNTANDEQTYLRNGQTPFPKIIAVKNKIRKFSNAKLFLRNKADFANINKLIDPADVTEFSNMTFNRITLKYVDAGKYRGD